MTELGHLPHQISHLPAVLVLDLAQGRVGGPDVKDGEEAAEVVLEPRGRVVDVRARVAEARAEDVVGGGSEPVTLTREESERRS